MSGRRAIVVGGGLAGIAAALDLGRAGMRVSLLERRRQLGGRAASFRDPVDGRIVDNCQHVLLGSCTELMELYRALGVADRIVWRDRFHVAGPGGLRATLAPTRWLPARLQFLPSFLATPLLSPRERWAVARAFAAMAGASDAEMKTLEDVSFADWLARRRVPPRAIVRLFDPVLVSALNESLDRVSARTAFFVLRGSFLAGGAACRMGLPNVPLSDLYAGAAERALAAAGVDVRLGADVTRVRVDGGALRGAEIGGALEEADAVVLATPIESHGRLAPSVATVVATVGVSALEFSPIVGAHFFFEPGVRVAEGELAVVERTAQWIFDRHAATGRDDDAGHLAVVVSAAHALADLPRDAIEARLLDDVREVVPSARGRTPRRSIVVKERAATFSPRPGAERLRPAARTAIRGLFLANDACATGWPATMEGAVRAGRAAAREALADDAAGARAGNATAAVRSS